MEFVQTARSVTLHQTCYPTAGRGRLHTQSLCCECGAGSTREMRSQVSDHRLRPLHNRNQCYECSACGIREMRSQVFDRWARPAPSAKSSLRMRSRRYMRERASAEFTMLPLRPLPRSTLTPTRRQVPWRQMARHLGIRATYNGLYGGGGRTRLQGMRRQPWD